MKKLIFYTLTLCLLLFSCKSRQYLVQQTYTPQGSVERTVEQIRQAQPKFKTLNISKMTLKADFGGRQQSVSGSCRITADSAIHISVQPVLGIEMFRLEMTADSIFLFDKFNGRYAASDYALFSKRFGVMADFYSFQALLTNRFFTYACSKNCTQYCSFKDNNLIYNNENIKQKFEINSLAQITRTEITETEKGYNLTAEYENVSLDYSKTTFPEKIKFTASNKSGTAAVIEICISKISADANLTMQPLDKTRYAKVDEREILPK